MKQIWDVHFSPAGYYFLSGSSDGTMILWKTDVPNAQRIFYHKSEVNKVSFAKDPSFAISAGDDGFVKLWKVADGELVRV
jgi:transcription initiation factor TFIID subunit 5